MKSPLPLPLHNTSNYTVFRVRFFPSIFMSLNFHPHNKYMNIPFTCQTYSSWLRSQGSHSHCHSLTRVTERQQYRFACMCGCKYGNLWPYYSSSKYSAGTHRRVASSYFARMWVNMCCDLLFIVTDDDEDETGADQWSQIHGKLTKQGPGI